MRASEIEMSTFNIVSTIMVGPKTRKVCSHILCTVAILVECNSKWRLIAQFWCVWLSYFIRLLITDASLQIFYPQSKPSSARKKGHDGEANLEEDDTSSSDQLQNEKQLESSYQQSDAPPREHTVSSSELAEIIEIYESLLSWGRSFCNLFGIYLF